MYGKTPVCAILPELQDFFDFALYEVSESITTAFVNRPCQDLSLAYDLIRDLNIGSYLGERSINGIKCWPDRLPMLAKVFSGPSGT